MLSHLNRLTEIMLMRLLMTLLAPALGWIAFRLFRLPLLKQSRRKHHTVMKLFRLAADYGSVRALSVYGHLLFYRGEGLNNKIQGAIYLERAADKGDAKAAYQMARIYETGFDNYPINHDKSLHYYRVAGDHGHRLAITRLIAIYSQGELSQQPDLSELNYWQTMDRE